ncbi:MAG: 2-octaprenyl-6-methoxyphenyl hydroxylase [Zetaproteobacteria bacterium]|nr:MAG: 2-octaprenyl-6-methoxyphenyl hydroxylase [Zetaproteobacteria bacterium]
MKGQAHETYDIVIVGGGLAGVSLSISAAKMGLSVAVVEAHAVDAFPSSQPERVIALSHGSRCHLESLGVWTEIEKLGVARIRQVHIAEPGNRGEVWMHQTHADVDALGYVAQNAHILSALYATIPPEVAMLTPTRVDSLEVADDDVHVNVVRNNRKSRISCRLLVGADGSGSQVRRLRGIASRGWDHNRFGLVASVCPGKPHRSVAHECFRPSGPLAFLPLNSTHYSIVWTLTPRDASRIMAMDDVDFLRDLEAAAGSDMHKYLGGLTETGPRALFPFEFRMATSITASRTALIGNAAHTLHPVAGQGLNLGLRDVAVLADALSRACKAGRDVGSSVVLEEYRQRRMGDNLAVAAFTEGLNAIFSNDFLPAKLARGAGLLGVQYLSPVRDWLMRRTTGLAQAGSLGGDA